MKPILASELDDIFDDDDIIEIENDFNNNYGELYYLDYSRRNYDNKIDLIYLLIEDEDGNWKDNNTVIGFNLELQKVYISPYLDNLINDLNKNVITFYIKNINGDILFNTSFKKSDYNHVENNTYYLDNTIHIYNIYNIYVNMEDNKHEQVILSYE